MQESLVDGDETEQREHCGQTETQPHHGEKEEGATHDSNCCAHAAVRFSWLDEWCTLARAAVLLSRNKVMVKRLNAIQNFDAMDMLCTNKTGTLTQDKIALARHADAYGQDAQDAQDASLDGERVMPTFRLNVKLLARTKAVTAGLNADGRWVVAVAVNTPCRPTRPPTWWPTNQA